MAELPASTEDNPEENARRAILDEQRFESWAEWEAFQKELNTEGSVVALFELAVDAVVSGDAETLRTLLQQEPALIQRRSPRMHHGTLLIYVGANGFENWRQRTPPNAVEMAHILLEAGAEIDAIGAMYRGTTTLGLVATSVHPVKTGVQKALMEILIDHGADPNHAVAPDYTEGNLILACLHNGRTEPLAYLAQKGAAIELEGAGGVGDLEIVKRHFTPEGRLIDGSLTVKRDGCWIWACECGHVDIVNYLLETGINVATEWDGMTGLHAAAYGGQTALVRLLLDRGAPLEVKNSYGGTPLGQTIWTLYNHRQPGHLAIMEMLIAAGAIIEDDWWPYIREQRQAGG